jgi:hypothetical protein
MYGAVLLLLLLLLLRAANEAVKAGFRVVDDH